MNANHAPNTRISTVYIILIITICWGSPISQKSKLGINKWTSYSAYVKVVELRTETNSLLSIKSFKCIEEGCL